MFSSVKTILGLTNGFNPIEMAVLDAFARVLPDDWRVPWAERLKRIDLVQRIGEAREVNCYERRHGQVIFDPTGRLSESNEELLFGKMVLSFADSESIDVKLWVVRGYFFSMEFSAPMKNRVTLIFPARGGNSVRLIFGWGSATESCPACDRQAGQRRPGRSRGSRSDFRRR